MSRSIILERNSEEGQEYEEGNVERSDCETSMDVKVCLSHKLYLEEL